MGQPRLLGILYRRIQNLREDSVLVNPFDIRVSPYRKTNDSDPDASVLMVFTHPLFLILLIPWIVVVIWFLMGKGETVYVSTTRFWKTDAPHTAATDQWRPPPGWAVLVLSGLLCLIFYSSGFTFGRSVSGVRWVMDRHVWTQAVLSNDPERVRAIDRTKTVSVPDASDPFRPTAAPTLEQLKQTVQRLLHESDETLVVVTAQPFQIDHPRVQILRPDHAIKNAGIQYVALTLVPHPQIMVRVWNQTEQTQAVLRVDQARQIIELPEPGKAKEYFVDLTQPGPVVQVILELKDDLPVDNQAWLVLRSPRVRLEIGPGLSEPVARFASAYQQVHVPNPQSDRVIITRDPRQVPTGVVLKSGGRSGLGPLSVTDHPVVRWIDWERIRPLIDKSLSEDELSGDPVVLIGDRPVVTTGPGRVEIGFDLNRLSNRSELVTLLANAIEWVAGERGVYEWVGPGELGPEWQMEQGMQGIDHAPGVYVHPTLGRQAVSVPAIQVTQGPIRPLQDQELSDRTAKWVGPGLLLTGSILILMGLFCLTPKGRRVR